VAGKPVYPSIQILRGVAALSVVYFHAVLQVRPGLEQTGSMLPEFGAWGVDLFFVISGFVMWTSTAGRNLSPGEFYRRRIVRIAPLYWAITAFACSIALIAPQLLRSTRFEPVHAAMSFLFLPWPNPGLPITHPDLLSPIVIPGWTLNYEMFFYLIFGGSLLVSDRLRPFVVAALLAGSVVLATLLSPWLPVLKFYANTMLFEFLAGMLIGIFSARLKGLGPDWAAWAAMLALVVGMCVAEFALGLEARAITLGPLAAAVILVAVAADRHQTAHRSALLQKLGDASYSIYLIHIFVIAGFRVMLNMAGVRIETALDGMLFVAAAMLCSTAAGYVLYRLFEMPSTKLASRLLMGSSKRSVPVSHARPNAPG
jgi:exopolysaccharide production protein ExoZ